MKASMSNFDINAIISELTQRCSKSELKNIFELNDKFFFRFRTRTEGTLLLVIEPGKRIHVTKFKRDFPPSPSGLCKAFRIHIKGKWLKSIYQYDFDRICVLEFEAYEKVYTLIVELFGKGNLILLSPQDKILVAKNYKKMRDRDIHPGIEFKFPPSTGRNFIEADLDWVKETLLERKEKDIISLISKTLNINKIFAQEICLRMSLDIKLKPEDITDEIIDSIIAGVKKLRRNAKSSKLQPIIYRDSKTNEIVEISPFPMKVYEEYEKEKHESFSEALDLHFSTLDSDKVSSVEFRVEEKKIEQQVKVRQKQEDHLKTLLEQVEKEKDKGNRIYLYLTEIDELLQTITNARRNNIPWKEIKEKLDDAKERKVKGARLLSKIKEKSKTVIVELDGVDVELDFLKTASDNANALYKRAKKAEGKAPGTQKKIDEFSEKIRKLELGIEELALKEKILIEKRKREWFEKFRWFKSSDGFLVLAGKDLRTNNELVKKYFEKDDLFLHAEIHGAAVVIIKSDGKPIPESTINEAAIFSVNYSKAWKDRVSAEDTYWVTSDQVSFSAPTGEYLSKGSFIIKGKKNSIRNVPLEIAVYPIIEEKWSYIVSGPLSAIKAIEGIDKSKIIRVIPGDTLKSKIAKIIVSKILEGLDEKDTAKINATALNELISILPGDCYIKKE
ncbi:MAG: fibronectin-binding domain-containing protein [Candidatus Heimdallarchaeota archaeon]|nr:MAG: fibronectin-binding domain-containing protein [Candidatus Heimdallarchaeota archaeon]